MLKYEKIVVGQMQTNCYLVWDEETKEAVIIDPGDEGVEIAQVISEKKLKLLSVLATHGHFDHLMGAIDVMLIFKVPLGLSKNDWFISERMSQTAKYFGQSWIKTQNISHAEINLDKAISIRLGAEKMLVVKTPGHTPGSVCFYYEKGGWLITGDTLFADGSVGETSHEYSSILQLRQSVATLMNYRDETIILAGHGEEGALASCRRPREIEEI